MASKSYSIDKLGFTIPDDLDGKQKISKEFNSMLNELIAAIPGLYQQVFENSVNGIKKFVVINGETVELDERLARIISDHIVYMHKQSPQIFKQLNTKSRSPSIKSSIVNIRNFSDFFNNSNVDIGYFYTITGIEKIDGNYIPQGIIKTKYKLQEVLPFLNKKSVVYNLAPHVVVSQLFGIYNSLVGSGKEPVPVKYSAFFNFFRSYLDEQIEKRASELADIMKDAGYKDSKEFKKLLIESKKDPSTETFNNDILVHISNFNKVSKDVKLSASDKNDKIRKSDDGGNKYSEFTIYGFNKIDFSFISQLIGTIVDSKSYTQDDKNKFVTKVRTYMETEFSKLPVVVKNNYERYIEAYDLDVSQLEDGGYTILTQSIINPAIYMKNQ